MNPDSEKTADIILNSYDENTLRTLFYRFGEIRNAGCLAAAINSWRQQKSLITSGDLLEAIKECIPFKNRQHYLAKVFQALRIEVNDELTCLEEMLDCIIPDGALFYGTNRRRHDVVFDEALRDETERCVTAVHELFKSGKTPMPVADKRCNRCSLKEQCLPETFSKNLSRYYARLMELQE